MNKNNIEIQTMKCYFKKEKKLFLLVPQFKLGSLALDSAGLPTSPPIQIDLARLE